MTEDGGLVTGPDGLPRCWWGASHEAYLPYHDHEWGHPQADDFRLFEKLCLEGFQAGLSWLTVLRKRPAFREVFHGFDYRKVAEMGEEDVLRLLDDARIIRHRKKIESAINNAHRACELADVEGSLAAYFWQWEPPASERRATMTKAKLYELAKTDTSTRLAKDLKKRGWSFLGPTTCYAFMQSMGLVNDHLEGCHARQTALDARSSFSLGAKR